jgi:hypothetical protein
MRDRKTTDDIEIVSVEVHGRLIDSVSFMSPAQAEGYKAGVRRWAREKGILVGIWSHRTLQDISLGAPAASAAGAI